MNKDKYIKKLNAFKDNFNFISTDSTVLNSLVVKAIEESLKLYEDNEKEFFKYALTLLKKYIKDEINKEYEKDRDELFKRVISSVLLSKNLDILTKTEIFSSFIKAIRIPIEDKFYKKILTDNPKLSNYFNNIIVTDGKSIFVDSELEDYCKPFSSFLEIYINSLDSEKTIFLKREKNKNTLSRKEEIEIFRRIKNGDSIAVSEFLEYNIPLVKKVASKYINRGVDFDDLFQQGCMGVLKAIEFYDINKGFAFSTYAVNWIKQSITRYIEDNSRTIRLPVHLGLKMNKLRVLIEEAEKEEKRELTRGELAEKIGVPVSTIDEYYNFILPIVSINSKVGIEENSELEEFILDNNDYISEMLEDDYISKFMKELKLILKDREFDIVCRRNGLLNYKVQTLEEIGKVYNLTRERIRQLEAKTYKKIRRNRKLSEYLETSIKKPSNKILTLDKNKLLEKLIPTTTLDFISYFKTKYGIDDLNLLLSVLSEKEIECLKRRYGENLSEVIEVSSSTITDASYIVYYLIPKRLNLVKTSDNLSSEEIPKKEKSNLVNELLDNYKSGEDSLLLNEESLEEDNDIDESYIKEKKSDSKEEISNAPVVIKDGIEFRRMTFDEEANTLAIEDSLSDEDMFLEEDDIDESYIEKKYSKPKEEKSTSSVVVKDGVEYRKMNFDYLEPSEENTLPIEDIALEEIDNDDTEEIEHEEKKYDSLYNELILDEEDVLDFDEENRKEVLYDEDFLTEIKPYLIGLRDSITSIIEIIDEYNEEKLLKLEKKK